MRARRPTVKQAAPATPPAAKKKRKKAQSASKKIGTQRRIRQHLRKAAFGLMLLLVLALIGGTVWAVRDGFFVRSYDATRAACTNQLERLSFSLGLTLKEIRIEGIHYVNREVIMDALALSPDTHYAMLTLSGAELAGRLKSIEFIRHASVEKSFPDTIVIRVTERDPVAIWQHQGMLSLIDEEGVVLKERDVGAFWKLPMLVGQDAVFHAKTLLAFLTTQPKLFEQVAAMTHVSGRRWDIVMQNGTTIRLPEESPDTAWATLASLENEQQLLEKQIKIIDLRLPEKVYILPLPPQLPDDDGKAIASPAPATEATEEQKEEDDKVE